MPLYAAPALPILSPTCENESGGAPLGYDPTRRTRRAGPRFVACRGSPAVLHSPDMRICDVVGCDKKHHAKGYCSKHYHDKPRPGDRPISPIVAAAEKITVWAVGVPDDTGSAVYSAAMIAFLSAYLDNLAATADARPADIASLAARCALFVANIGKLDAATPTDPGGDDPFAAFLEELETAAMESAAE